MTPPSSAREPPADPVTLLRSRAYVQLLVIAAVLGVPISAVAYGFLVLSTQMQHWLFTDLPDGLGFHGAPAWWPAPLLVVGGLLVGLVVRYFPGRGGGSPLDGVPLGGGPPQPLPLLGIPLAALAGLGFGAVVGPEAPLVAIGGGLAAATVRLARRGAPAQTLAVVAAAGSFAAISALLGSPLSGAFLLMEAAGIGGAMLRPILLPGLVASGVGTLVFIGLDAWTGLGTFTLALPDLPAFARPDVAQFAWALAIGVAAAVVVALIRRLATPLRPLVERRVLLAPPPVGPAAARPAICSAGAPRHDASHVPFSGPARRPAAGRRAARQP